MLLLTSYIYKGSCPAEAFVRESQEEEIKNRKEEDRIAED
jgi:hypothetical protein